MIEVQMIQIDKIRPNPDNARTHSKKQIAEIAASIKAFGWTVPILIDEHGYLIAGHGRLAAAKCLGFKCVPAVTVHGLSEARKRALALADNKIAANAGWSRELLATELPELAELLIEEGLDVALTGFSAVEFDQLMMDFEENSVDPSDEIDRAWLEEQPVTRPGDLWRLGDHLLLCGDARRADDLASFMGKDRAAAAFLDPPYNVRVKSVVGRGRIRHNEFAMASGEMSPALFTSFLQDVLSTAASFSRDGAVHFVCMDWRHLGELLEAGREVYGAMLNLAVWVKPNCGQGTFYRSQHEIVGVFRVGDGTHLNNIQLGRHGRNRSNVWHYAGVNSFRSGRLEELSAHPTVKPVPMVADALKDCTRRGDIVLDTFCGSGTTILAAERVGRLARAMEIEPRYVDVAIRRWQAFTKRDAIHVQSGQLFDDRVSNKSAASKRLSPKRSARRGVR